MLEIEIKAGVGQGKTTTALVIREALESLGCEVEVFDADLADGKMAFDLERLKPFLKGKKIRITTKQLSRDAFKKQLQ